MRYVVTLHKAVVCREGVTYENSRSPGRSVVGEIYHTGLLLQKGRGRLRNSGLDQYFWISLKRVPLLLKHIGLPLKLFKLLTKVNIGFKHSKFSQGSALFSSYPAPGHLSGHSFSRCFLTCPTSGLELCRAVSWECSPGCGLITRAGRVTKWRDAVLLPSPPLTNIHPEEGWSWSSTLATKLEVALLCGKSLKLMLKIQKKKNAC